MHPIIIRRADRTDRSEWLRMRQLLWPQLDPVKERDEMDAMLDNPLTPVFVAERSSGGLCGFLEAGTRPYADGCDTSPVGYIEGWFVDEDVRSTGVGRLLVIEAENWARRLGLHEMASDTAISNHAGYRAHLALGYKEMEHLIHFCKNL